MLANHRLPCCAPRYSFLLQDSGLRRSYFEGGNGSSQGPLQPRRTVMPRKLAIFIFALVSLASAWAGEVRSGYKVLAPISHGNLTIFPVVASSTHDASEFLTLDEGLRTGDVIVTEAGRIQPLIRRGGRPIPIGGGEVNRLVLVNNSNRPLLLLAGEIVTGGKQDRVIGKDRIVPAHSDPVDLSVFCVEPGRWTEVSSNFKGMSSQMAQPSVRNKAMVAKNQ